MNLFIDADNAMILYVSRGLLSSLTDAREVMDVVSLHNARTGHKVIINTYAVIDGELCHAWCSYLQNGIVCVFLFFT